MDEDEEVLVDYKTISGENNCFLPEIVCAGQQSNTGAIGQTDYCPRDPIEDSPQYKPLYHETSTSKALKWGNEETNLLLDMYRIYCRDVGPFKKFKNKKTMWQYIAHTINCKFNTKWNGIQVETRYKVILRKIKREKGVHRETIFPPIIGIQIKSEEIIIDSPNEYVCSDFEETNKIPKKTGALWGNTETNFMLGLYQNCSRKVGVSKRFTRKKDMWSYIASKINAKFDKKFDAIQVETRYKCVMKRTKKKIVQNIKNESITDSENEEYVNSIVNFDNSISSETVLPPVTSNGIETSSHISIQTQECNNDHPVLENDNKRLRKTLREKLFERYLAFQEIKFQALLKDKAMRHREKERRKDERHKEKMQLIAEILKRHKN